MADTIPVVDLSQFIEGSEDARLQFAQELGLAFEKVGFVAVQHHGVHHEIINDLYSEVQAFFALAPIVKAKYEIPGLAGQRGYTSFGKEHAKGAEVPDLKEFFQFGQEVQDESVPVDLYPPNVNVEEIPTFTPTLLKAYRAFENTGLFLLRAIALYLKLPRNYFDEHVKDGNSILRAIHYPPITSEPKHAIRAEQHEDINLITLLVGASAAGLEILNKQNEWQPVTSQPDQIVVNVGDMLQRLTNNKLKSTTHRVVNPSRDQWGTSRYSIPFFLHPKSDMDLSCLDGCVNAENPKAYDDYTAGQYLDERLREIGLKK